MAIQILEWDMMKTNCEIEIITKKTGVLPSMKIDRTYSYTFHCLKDGFFDKILTLILELESVETEVSKKIITNFLIENEICDNGDSVCVVKKYSSFDNGFLSTVCLHLSNYAESGDISNIEYLKKYTLNK